MSDRAVGSGVGWHPRTRAQMAARLASDIPEGWFVNLGIGLPTSVADYIPDDHEVFFHSENGVLGVGPAPAPGDDDRWLINAGKQPVTLRPGGSFFHHSDSFAMIRGGHIDLCVLGALQVSELGDIANWATSIDDAAPGVGGAMDLAVGARRVWVLMEHTTKDGRPKIVRDCTMPLTARSAVSRIYTNLAVIDVTPAGLVVDELLGEIPFEDLQARTDAKVTAREIGHP